MNNLILYKGGITFLLLQNVPETNSYFNGIENGLTAGLLYEEAMKACEESAKEIINPELLPTFPKPHINGWVLPKNLKPGDTFPLPEGVFADNFGTTNKIVLWID
jgi:hypothetical protein